MLLGLHSYATLGLTFAVAQLRNRPTAAMSVRDAQTQPITEIRTTEVRADAAVVLPADAAQTVAPVVEDAAITPPLDAAVSSRSGKTKDRLHDSAKKPDRATKKDRPDNSAKKPNVDRSPARSSAFDPDAPAGQ